MIEMGPRTTLGAMAALRTFVAPLGSRRTAAAILLTAWFVVIIIGAGQAADGASWIGVPSFDWIGYVLLALVGMGLIVVVAAMLMADRSTSGPPPKRKPLWPMLIVGLVLLLLMRRDRSAETPPPPDVTPAEPSEPAVDDIVAGGAGLGGQELIVLLVMVSVALGVVLASRRRSVEPTADEDATTLARAVGPAVTMATEQLLTGTDPRSAVLMAYRTLEASLETHGLDHDPAETPSEYLQRALADLPLDTAPLLTLSDLYQEARFSAHEITVADQRAAQAALEQVGRQLEQRLEQGLGHPAGDRP
jgi:hypothetical protein